MDLAELIVDIAADLAALEVDIAAGLAGPDSIASQTSLSSRSITLRTLLNPCVGEPQRKPLVQQDDEIQDEIQSDMQ